MLFDFILKAIKIIQTEKHESISASSDLLSIRKREIFHKGIPDIEVVRTLAGKRYYDLLAIINRFDPIKTPPLKTNPNKYQFLTKTLIYKLPDKKNRQAVADLLSLEFSLWFKHEYNAFEDKEALIDEVYNFKIRHLKTNPFLPENTSAD
ncbi:MAG: hypothetical protein WAQ28_20960 [Bacteroidia bacterium]|jgi:hypothetical protein